MKNIKIYCEINSLDKKTETPQTEKKDNLEKVIEAFKHVVSSKEWEEMEQAIKDLTKEQKEKVSEFIDTEIKPALKELKDSIFDKEKRHEIIEKIKNKIHELMEKIKEMQDKKENTYENKAYLVMSSQVALLNQALKQNEALA